MNRTRHQSYRDVVDALQKEGGLRPREKEVLRDSAEGLLLDDRESRELLQKATEQLSNLVVSDRWRPDQADDFLELLQGCASSEISDEPF